MKPITIGDLVWCAARHINHKCRDILVARVVAISDSLVLATVEFVQSCAIYAPIGHDKMHRYALIGEMVIFYRTEMVANKKIKGVHWTTRWFNNYRNLQVDRYVNPAEFRRLAEARIEHEQDLRPYAEYILDAWTEDSPDQDWQWVATAPCEDILGWRLRSIL